MPEVKYLLPAKNQTMFLPYRIWNYARRLVFRLTVAPFFGKFGSRSSVLRPRAIEGIGRISIGNDVYVADAAVLAAVPHSGLDNCELQIGDGCKLGSNNHIYATASIVFEPQVLTASNVYVADNMHGYEDAERAIMDQPVQQLRKVRIGKGSWLGQNVCVVGASIGRGCVIGANSVVLSDIPDYCVVVGAPGRIVRRRDPRTGIWESVKGSDTRPKRNLIEN